MSSLLKVKIFKFLNSCDKLNIHKVFTFKDIHVKESLRNLRSLRENTSRRSLNN